MSKKWIGGIAGLVVGAFISPEAAAVLAVIGFTFGLLLQPQRRDAQAERSAPDGEIARLRAELRTLADRVETLEQALHTRQVQVPDAAMPEPAAAEAAVTVPLPEPPAEAEPTPAAPTAPVPLEPLEPAVVHVAAEPAAAPPPRPAPPPAVPWPDRLPAPVRAFLFGGNTLVKVGVLLLFLGLAFLLRYAAERVTVPLPLRYAGVAGVGVVLLAIGWRLRRVRSAYGLILQGAGIGVFYLTTLAAMKLHDLIPAGLGFGVLLAVAVLAGLLAVLQNAMSLALVATLEGFAAPVLVATGSTSPVGLFTYLAVLDLGVLGMAWFKAWRPLHLVALAGTLALAGGWAREHYEPAAYGVTQSFLILFLLMFSGMGLLFARRSLQVGEADDPMETRASLLARAGQALHKVGRVDSALVFGAPLSGYGLQYLLVQDRPLGPALAAVAFGLLHAVLARIAFAGRRPGMRLLAEAHAIVAVLFGTLAIPLGLEGRWTGAAWALEAAGMVWLGLRQHRPYARLFGLLVLAGAATRLLQEIEPGATAGGPWLQGSTLGPALLALAAWVVAWLMRRAGPAGTSGEPPALFDALEAWGAQALPWLAGAALALLPWMLLRPLWAPAAAGLLAVALHATGQRAAWPAWARVAVALQAVAALGLLGAVQPNPAAGGNPVLADGWQAVGSSVMLALCLIATTVLAARPTWRAARDGGHPPAWSLRQTLGLVVGVALLHLAVLFVAPWSTVAWVWPLMAALTLASGLRGVVPALIGLSAGVQTGAVLLSALLAHGGLDAGPAPGELARPFVNPAFLTALLQAVVALGTALALHRVGRRQAQTPDHPLAGMQCQLGWLHRGAMRWPPLIAGLLLWGVAWAPELSWALERAGAPAMRMALWLAGLTASSLAAAALARRQRWPEMGLAARGLLPLAALLAVGDAVDQPWPWLPLHDGGWWAWPAVLTTHLALLRRWQPDGLGQRLEAPLHALGLWMLTGLAALQAHGALRLHTPAGSAWAPAAGMAVVAVLLAAVSLPQARSRWPVSAQGPAYRGWGALPLVAAAALGLLAANLDAGLATPLPYLPLLNPLELAMALAATALLLWQRNHPASPRTGPATPGSYAALGTAGLYLLSGAVLRACHHIAGVPWEADALWASTLAQAALSITWALAGVAAMGVAARRARRESWIAGAVLLGIVVLKLFAVELADRGSLARIVSFLAVGVLLLLVGYFAPIPARQATAAPGAQP